MPFNTKEKLKAYLEKNKDHIKQLHVARAKRWQEKNKQKASLQRKEWSLKNKEKMDGYKKEWSKKNKDKRTTWEANRRALKFRATIRLTELDKFVVNEMYNLAQTRTEQTRFDWHVDHIKPLTKGGLHKPTNLQVVPARWNISKGNRNSDVYLKVI